MEATHARSMTAYAGLCAAAVVVLSQSVTPTGPSIAEAIATAGRAAAPVAATVTIAMSASAEVAELGTDVVASAADLVVTPVVRTVTAPVVADAPQRRQQKAAPVERQVVAEPVVIAASPRDASRSGVSTPDERKTQQTDRRAERSDARTDRRTDRAADRAERRADRAAAKAQRLSQRR